MPAGRRGGGTLKAPLVAAYQQYREHSTDESRDHLLGEVGRYALSMYCRDAKLQPATRDDLTQETTIRVWKNLGRFDDRSSIATWVHRIAANVRNDHFSRSKIEAPLPEHKPGARGSHGQRDRCPCLACMTGTFRESVEELPAWLLDDPIARDLMDDTTTVANLQKKHFMSKAQWYRHLHALGRQLTEHNLGKPLNCSV
jgi:DNA-directed RNA polymerase specialized sigma24 family protein